MLSSKLIIVRQETAARRTVHFWGADSLQVGSHQFPVRLHVCVLSQIHTFNVGIGFLYSSIVARKRVGQRKKSKGEKNMEGSSLSVQMVLYVDKSDLN